MGSTDAADDDDDDDGTDGDAAAAPVTVTDDDGTDGDADRVTPPGTDDDGDGDAVTAGAAPLPSLRVRRARRIVVLGLIGLQLAMVVRAYVAPHREFGFQMFPEASDWQAEIVRVTEDGSRVPIGEPWSGYVWRDLVRGRGLEDPSRRRHADAGVDNQVEFLREALDWVAANTPADRDTRYLEAEVTVWRNLRGPERMVLRSPERGVVP